MDADYAKQEGYEILAIVGEHAEVVVIRSIWAMRHIMQ